MIVTKKIRTIYKVEMTDRQRRYLLLLMESICKDQRQLIAIQAEHGMEKAKGVAETCDDLYESLKPK